MKVGETKRKEQVWLSSGEEILARSGIISWEEDVKHLQNQLKSDQIGTCGARDMKQKRKNDRKLRDSQKEDARREASKRQMCREKEVEEDDDAEEDNNNDASYTPPRKRCPKDGGRRKVNLMASMAAAGDRSNTSCRTIALLGAAAAKGLGVKWSATNCSYTSAWRQRTKEREKKWEDIKSSWSAPYAVILHWDGKTLKLRRGQSANFVAIYVSGKSH